MTKYRLSASKMDQLHKASFLSSDEQNPLLAPKNVTYISKLKVEEVIKKVASKAFTINKCIETTKQFSDILHMEQNLLKKYYDTLWILQEAGCRFRNFEKIGWLFNPLIMNKAKNNDHIIALSISPDFLPAPFPVKENYVILSPVLILKIIGKFTRT